MVLAAQHCKPAETETCKHESPLNKRHVKRASLSGENQSCRWAGGGNSPSCGVWWDLKKCATPVANPKICVSCTTKIMLLEAPPKDTRICIQIPHQCRRCRCMLQGLGHEHHHHWVLLATWPAAATGAAALLCCRLAGSDCWHQVVDTPYWNCRNRCSRQQALDAAATGASAAAWHQSPTKQGALPTDHRLCEPAGNPPANGWDGSTLALNCCSYWHCCSLASIQASDSATRASLPVSLVKTCQKELTSRRALSST